MKKLYFIVPIILLGIFVYFYLNAKSGIHEAEVARQVKQQKDAEERQRKEEQAKKDAWELANAEANRRIAEITARQEKERKYKEEQTLLTDQRDVAFREKKSLAEHAEQLIKDLDIAKQQKAKIEEQLKIQRTQVDYLKTAAKDVAQNRTAFQTALEKLETAERAFAAAEQQRAQALRSAQQK